MSPQFVQRIPNDEFTLAEPESREIDPPRVIDVIDQTACDWLVSNDADNPTH